MGDFLKVEYAGKTGYARGDYLRLHDTDAEILTVVNCRESVTLRKEPSTSAEALAPAFPWEARFATFRLLVESF